MKYINLLVFLMLTSLQSFAQLPISWQLGINKSNSPSPLKILETADSCIYLFGDPLIYDIELLKPYNDKLDFYLSKIDRFGCLLWSRPIRSEKNRIILLML
ncbi:MAG: hypothetical protein IPJ43_01620 [Saprospiraceae bacterium]|nr:hypothetical protein [Saprospiraceae bacterium]